MLKCMRGNFVIPETLQLWTPLYLKGPVPSVIGWAMLTLLYGLPYYKVVLIWFCNWCGFTLVGMVLFTTCVVWVCHYLLRVIHTSQLCACLRV